MKKFYYIIVFVLLSDFVVSQSLAPEVISSAGDFYNNGNVSLSWTLGEGVTETFSNSNNSLTQGFQQSNYGVVEIETIEENLNISLYPNPTAQYLNLDWDISGNFHIGIELFDIQGRSLIVKTFSENIAQKQINLSSFPSAEYLLRVSKGINVVKTYKITKY